MKSISSIKNIIAKCLGCLWIIDGLLQLQPKMFGAEFVNNVLVPNVSNQPHLLSTLITLGIHFWDVSPVLSNTLAVLIQIVIGALLLFPLSSKKFKTGLIFSIVWGLLVWIFGEGAGLLFTGTASFYTGAPGSALLYIILSALLLMNDKVFSWAPVIGAGVLTLGSILQVQSSFWSAGGIQNSLMASSMESVHTVAHFPIYITNLLSVQPIIGNTLLVMIPLTIALFIVLVPSRAVALVALIFLFLVWWIGQDFGMITTLITGTSTDPNTVPLLTLFILPLVSL